MSNNNYHSEVAANYRNNRNSRNNNFNSCSDNNNNGNSHNNEINCNSHNDDDNSRCCGRRFNNRPNDEKVQMALRAFARQLANTTEAINCLNQLFNNLEDNIFEDRCCVSNRIKNILRSIQTDICDLDDDVRSIGDDLECLDQAL